jgi:hypothetical protein
MNKAEQLRVKFDNDLKELQDKCTHESSDWMPYMWAPGHFGLPVKVCIHCDKILEHKQIEYNSTIISEDTTKEKDHGGLHFD